MKGARRLASATSSRYSRSARVVCSATSTSAGAHCRNVAKRLGRRAGGCTRASSCGAGGVDEAKRLAKKPGRRALISSVRIGTRLTIDAPPTSGSASSMSRPSAAIDASHLSRGMSMAAIAHTISTALARIDARSSTSCCGVMGTAGCTTATSSTHSSACLRFVRSATQFHRSAANASSSNTHSSSRSGDHAHSHTCTLDTGTLPSNRHRRATRCLIDARAASSRGIGTPTALSSWTDAQRAGAAVDRAGSERRRWVCADSADRVLPVPVPLAAVLLLLLLPPPFAASARANASAASAAAAIASSSCPAACAASVASTSGAALVALIA